jgi:hypothetical protein
MENLGFFKCNICGNDIGGNIDMLCSPECRRIAAINSGWKPPKNPKGWYVATFKSYLDKVNFSPSEIKSWNDKLNSVEKEQINLESKRTKLRLRLDKIKLDVNNIFPFHGVVYERESPFNCIVIETDEGGMPLLELNELVKSYRTHNKKEYNRLISLIDAYEKKINKINDELRKNEVWVSRKKYNYYLKPNNGVVN